MVCCRFLLPVSAALLEALAILPLCQKYQLPYSEMFQEAEAVLNDMAEENSRPPLVYGLEGEKNKEELFLDKSPTCFDLLHEPSLQRITVPLLVLWIYREYVYFGSFTLIPEVSEDYSKTFRMISISETVAVLISYPIRLKIRRVSTFITLIPIIAAASGLCSFTTVGEECRQRGESCSSKFLYRLSLMVLLALASSSGSR